MRNAYQQLTPRDKMLAQLSLGLIGLLLLWFVGLSPALTTLKTSAVEKHVLQKSLTRMKEQAQQAELWKKTPAHTYQETLTRLTQSMNALIPTATLATQGDQSIIHIDNATGMVLAKLLSALRLNANLKPHEWHMNKTPQGLWTGTISFKLPASP